MSAKKAFITGITGQDGSYLAELLLDKGYEVHGLVRRSSSFNTWRIDHVRDRLVLHYGDLVDQNSLVRTLELVGPDEIYNLAAQSHVNVSFEMPEYTVNVSGMGVLRLLDAVREIGLPARVYQAGSSEMFGLVQETPQSERTPFHPRSPYAAAKVFGHWFRLPAYGGIVTQSATVLFGAVFLYALARGFVHARRREIAAHREWMLRAFALGLGVATIRVVIELLQAVAGLGFEEVFGAAFWIGLGLNLAAAEAWIRRTRARPRELGSKMGA